MESKKLNDHNSKEYKIGYQIASGHRDNTNNTIKTLLTQVEAVFGDTKQGDAFKDLVKWEMWALCDRNQHHTYKSLDVEPGYETTPATSVPKPA